MSNKLVICIGSGSISYCLIIKMYLKYGKYFYSFIFGFLDPDPDPQPLFLGSNKFFFMLSNGLLDTVHVINFSPCRTGSKILQRYGHQRFYIGDFS
jgi:hypothetical protein